jgi:hypothetical protein
MYASEVRKHEVSGQKVVAKMKKMPAGVVVALFVVAGSRTVGYSPFLSKKDLADVT